MIYVRIIFLLYFWFDGKAAYITDRGDFGHRGELGHLYIIDKKRVSFKKKTYITSKSNLNMHIFTDFDT